MADTAARIKEEFEKCASGEGLTQHQACAALYQLGKQPVSKQITDFWVEEGLESDTISLEQFTKLYEHIPELATEDFVKALKVFDKDDNNTIDRNILMSILAIRDDVMGTGLQVEADTIQGLLDEGLADRDGKLDIDELAQFIMS